MDGILGQSRAIDALQAQLASGRLHHAYIFHGPAGVGKFTTALAFARVVLCHARAKTLTGHVEACRRCPSCRLLDAQERKPPAGEPASPDTTPQRFGQDRPDDAGPMSSAHPDLHVVAKELAMYSDDAATRKRKLLNIPVGVLRQSLIEPVSRAPRLGHGKVFVVDEAELLEATGQNLLLKTLEEPPGGATIILVTSSEDRLLPTISSRCQRIAFTPLPTPTMEQWLDDRGDAAGMSERGRRWLLSFAGGSPGRAELALTYDLLAWAKDVLPELDRLAKSGSPQSGSLGQRISGLIDDLAGAWVQRHANASKEAANKLAAGLMWSMLAAYARRELAGRAEQCDPADPLAADAALGPWLAVIDALGEAQRMLGSNVNLSLVCDHLVVNIAQALAPPRARAAGRG